MDKYTCPIPFGDDPSNHTDRDKVEYMKQLATDRRDKGIAIPRFVRAINKAYAGSGRSVSLEAYKEAERYPLKGIPLINEYLLQVAYDVLNSTRVQNSPQARNTAYAMTVIANARIARGFEYADMREKLNARGVAISEAEYRTSEQGITKSVDFEVIVEAARILGIAPGELFE